jgi:hypothetical protein
MGINRVLKSELIRTYPDLEYSLDKFEYKLKRSGLFIAHLALTTDQEQRVNHVEYLDARNVELAHQDTD